MIPDVLRLGPIPIHLFGLFLAAAFLAAGHVATREFVRMGRSAEVGSSLVVWVVFASLAGAKLWLVVQDWPYFVADPVGFLLTGSGWVFYGGLAGGALGATWVFRREGIAWLAGADACAPAIALGQTIGRLGCQVSGDGDWGVPTTLPWGMRYPYAVVEWPYDDPSIHVHPTPLYEAAAYLLVFAVLWRRRTRPHAPGTQFALYLLLASGARFFVEGVRTNPVVALGLTAAQWTSLALVVTGAAILLGARRWRPAAA